MREGWRIRKLGDLADLQRGLTYSKGDEVPFSSKRVLRSNNIDLESSKLDLTELKYLRDDFAIPDDRKVKKNSIFICMSNGSKQHVGKVAFIDTDIDYAFGGFMGLIVPKAGIAPKYVFYSCQSSAYRLFLSSIGNGIGITNLRFTDLANYSIPVPPIAEQEKIVAELDCLTDIIEKKRQQLEELDKLAQSIFYDMFGDPIANEKGWEVRKLGECFPYMKNGANIKQERGAEGIPITRIETLSGGVFNRDRLGYANILSVGKYDKNVLNDGDILMSHINSKAYIGRAVVYHKVPGEAIIHGMNLLRLIAERTLISPVFAEQFFKTDYFKKQIASIRKDAVNQSSVATGDLKALKVVLPPLDIQNEFARKIEAIEKQKELVKRSIVETEILFNSRMDFWFN